MSWEEVVGVWHFYIFSKFLKKRNKKRKMVKRSDDKLLYEFNYDTDFSFQCLG